MLKHSSFWRRDIWTLVLVVPKIRLLSSAVLVRNHSLGEGVDVKTLSRLLGHSDVSVTLRCYSSRCRPSLFSATSIVSSALDERDDASWYLIVSSGQGEMASPRRGSWHDAG